VAKSPLKVQQTRNIAARTAAYAANNAVPDNDVAWDGNWGGTWADAGYTSGGLHFSTNVPRSPLEVDQELDPIALIATGRTATMNTNLSEFDVDAILLGTGQGSVDTLAATTAARGYEEWSMGSTISDDGIAVGFDIDGRDGEPIRLIGWNGYPNADMTLDFVKDSSTGVLIPLSVQLTPDPNNAGRIATIRDLSPIAA
jgi:hypothetical protein